MTEQLARCPSLFSNVYRKEYNILFDTGRTESNSIESTANEKELLFDEKQFKDILSKMKVFSFDMFSVVFSSIVVVIVSIILLIW